MLTQNVETFIGCDRDYAGAKTVLFGAPYDSTTSYRPGARFGSRAIRGESYGLETYSPYQQKDLADCAVMDAGDLELPFGDPVPVLEAIRNATLSILQHRKRPVMLGGEHLVTLGAVEAAVSLYPELHIVHFDAHADLRQDYLGTTLSHACVMRRCWDILGDGRILQFGIRSGDKAEFLWAQKGHVILHPFDFDTLASTLDKLGDVPLYFTIDLDVLDPSVFPGTGTPEAGGVDFLTLYKAMETVCRGGRIIGADLCELAPNYDPSGVSTAVACKVLRELLLLMNG